MDEDCLVDCDKCNGKTQREIRIEVSNFPQVLMVQLKRFKTVITNKGKLKKVKIKTDVHFEKTLTLNGHNYDLVSIVNHFGEINSGHYTAFGKVLEEMENSQEKQIWYEFDDHKVKELKVQGDVSSSAAYLLFYTKAE
jgi:ubiquitin C-terminal hydrolase